MARTKITQTQNTRAVYCVKASNISSVVAKWKWSEPTVRSEPKGAQTYSHTHTHTRRNNEKKRRINEFDVHTPLNHYLCIGILHTLAPFFPIRNMFVRRHHILSNYRSENLIYNFSDILCVQTVHISTPFETRRTLQEDHAHQTKPKMRSVFKVFYSCHCSLAHSLVHTFILP